MICLNLGLINYYFNVKDAHRCSISLIIYELTWSIVKMLFVLMFPEGWYDVYIRFRMYEYFYGFWQTTIN